MSKAKKVAPKSVTLSKDIRRRIASAMFSASALGEKSKNTMREEKQIAYAARDWTVRKHRTALDSLPSSYVRCDYGIGVDRVPVTSDGISRYNHFLFYRDDYIESQEKQDDSYSPYQRRAVDEMCPVGVVLYEHLSVALQKQVSKFVSGQEDRKIAKRKLKEEIYAMLESHKSTKQLLETMPELEACFPDDVRERMYPKHLPIVSAEAVAKLRKHLNT